MACPVKLKALAWSRKARPVASGLSARPRLVERGMTVTDVEEWWRCVDDSKNRTHL